MSTGNLRGEKEQFFKRTVMHCRHCRQDTLYKKHMALVHHRRECLYLLPPGLQMDDGEEVDDDEDEDVLDGMQLDLHVVGDRNMLQSPRFHDLDDFEDLLGGEFVNRPDRLETVDRSNRTFV